MNKADQQTISKTTILKGEFSFYNAPITNASPARSITLKDLYSLIVGHRYKGVTEKYRQLLAANQEGELKKIYFDYVTFCGTFSSRKNDALIAPSGYIVLDIDKQSNVNAIKERLIADKELDPQLIFISPGGEGLKAVVEYDVEEILSPNNGDGLSRLWPAINTYLAANYNDLIRPDARGNYIDPSGKDLSRACFICYDENCFINSKILNNVN